MEVQVSPTPEETITSDIERELLSYPKDPEDHRNSAVEVKTDRETEGNAAENIQIMSKMGRKMLKRREGVEYVIIVTPEEGGKSTSTLGQERLSGLSSKRRKYQNLTSASHSFQMM
ncbi:hypothetical protein JTB14_026037 [Gonioctena quinquepunctata]|nr:hypothetical protein JTB14_026037 [Gonioctena quinquepunctata]